MNNGPIDVKKLAEDLRNDIEEFYGEDILYEVIFMHVIRAYKLGQESKSPTNKAWWDSINKDAKYIKSWKNKSFNNKKWGV